MRPTISPSRQASPAARLAVIERGVLARRPVREIIAVERGNIVRVIGIEPVGILHKLAQLVLGRDLGHDDRAVLFKLLHENILLTKAMDQRDLWSGDSIARIAPDFNLFVCGYSPNHHRFDTKNPPGAGTLRGTVFLFLLTGLGTICRSRRRCGCLAFPADLQNVGCEAEAPVDECICVHAALPLS